MKEGKGILFAATLLFALQAQARAGEKEPALTIEMGGSGGWPVNGGFSSYGPETALEYTVIEHWLEIELETSPQYSRGQIELETVFLLKKPFELTDRLEFLIGAGPAWIYTAGSNAAAIEIVPEFVYAAWPKKHMGIFFEPFYTYEFGKGHQQSLGFTAGLHIGIE